MRAGAHRLRTATSANLRLGIDVDIDFDEFLLLSDGVDECVHSDAEDLDGYCGVSLDRVRRGRVAWTASSTPSVAVEGARPLAGEPALELHQLRHTHATELTNDGVSTRTIQ